MRFSLCAILFIFLLWCGFAAPAQAQEANVPPLPRLAVRVGVHEDFQRIVFDWAHPVPFTLQQRATDMQLRFASSVEVDASPIMRRPLSFVQSATVRHEGETTVVALTLAAHVVAQNFQDARHVVVDLRRGDPPQNTPTEAAQAATAPAAILPPKPPLEKTPSVQTQTELSAPLPVPTPTPTPTQAPKQRDVAIPPPPVSAPAADKSEKDAPIAEPRPATPSSSQLNAAPPDRRAEPAPGVQNITQPQPAPKKEPVKYVAPELGKIGDQPVLLLAFDPGLVTGAAIYSRAHFVYLVFDKKLTAPLDQLIRKNAALQVETLDAIGGSAFRFYLPQDLSLRVTRDDSTWFIYATHKTRSAPISLTVQPQPNYAVGARIIIPLSKAGDPVRLYDPEVGDLVLVVPLLQPGQAMRQAYHYADFDFVPTEQGLAIRPRIDGVEIKHLTQGIEITTAAGLRLSPDRDTGIVNSDSEGQSGPRLYDFPSWFGPKTLSFTEMRQRWERALVEVPEQERDRVRLGMARFLFARNHAQEAMGLLNLLQNNIPEIEKRSEFLALRGAVKVLMHDAQGAVKDLNNPELADRLEIKLWMAAANARLLKWKEANELFMASDTILDNYPEPFFTRFSITAIETAIAANNHIYAANTLDRLVQRRAADPGSYAPAINYLRGVLLSLAGHLDRAEDLWKEASAGKDRLYQVRAELALIDLAVIKGKITPGEAAEKLERLRYAWRGDDLELDILRRLGKFYVEAGKVEDGLATLKQVLAFLPDNQAADAQRREMATIFRDVFLDEKGAKLSPLDALSLYERFYELAPPGEEGDAIIRTLAERMVAVDLLDRAADILADQARRRLSNTFKSRVGTQAAGIYLLDHKPDAALQVLNDTEQGALPPDLVEERLILKAKATADLGKNDEAKALLKDMDSEYAQRLKADIAWRSRNWVEAAKYLEALIGPPPAPGVNFSAQTAQLIINRAIALAMANDTPALEALHKNFEAAMKATPQAELFHVLTEPESGIPRDEAAMKSFMADVDLFQDFLENYRQIK